jgi:hypothetical protein
MADYNLDIQYIEEKKNCIADLLSRPPEVALNTVAVGLQLDETLVKRFKQLYKTDRSLLDRFESVGNRRFQYHPFWTT